MAVLEDPRYEAFAVGVAIDKKSDIQAYKDANGCTYDAAHANAHRMRAIEGIQARITELSSKLTERRVLTKARTLELLHDVAETPAGALTPDSPLCQSVKYGPEGQILELKMPNKLDALKMNAQMQGWLSDQPTVNVLLNLNLGSNEVREAPVIDVESQQEG